MASNEVKVTQADTSQSESVSQPASARSSWFGRHWLILVIILGFCVISAPFLMSVMQIMKETTRIFQDLGDGLAKVIDLVAAALGAIIENCEQQKTACVVVEIIGSVVGGFAFLTWLARSAMQIRNGFRGEGERIPVSDPDQRPANRLAILDAERSGDPESEVKRQVNKEILKSVDDRTQAAQKSFKDKGLPFPDALKYQISEAFAQSEINTRADAIAKDDKLSPDLKRRALDLANLSGIERDAAKQRAQAEATKEAKDDADKAAREKALDEVFAEK
jgi:hypothetical protein